MRYLDGFCSALCRRAEAVAFIRGSDKYKSVRGRVTFYSHNGKTIVRAEITGLPKGENGGKCDNPIFAFHIHGGERCAGNEKDPFADVGMHYNPANCRHPFHSGDMPPLFGADGSALSVFLTNRFSVGDVIGKTVIIHSAPDDFTTQPSGNAGEKIACGVIQRL